MPLPISESISAASEIVSTPLKVGAVPEVQFATTLGSMPTGEAVRGLAGVLPNGEFTTSLSSSPSTFDVSPSSPRPPSTFDAKPLIINPPENIQSPRHTGANDSASFQNGRSDNASFQGERGASAAGAENPPTGAETPAAATAKALETQEAETADASGETKTNPHQARFAELEKKRLAGELKKPDEIEEYTQLQSEQNRDTRIATLEDKFKSKEGLSTDEQKELTGLLREKEKAENPKTSEEVKAEKAKALIDSVVKKGEFTTEDYRQFTELCGEAPAGVSEPLQAATEAVMKSYIEGVRKSEPSKDTKDTERLIQEFADHMRKYRQKEQELKVYAEEVEKQIEVVDAAEEEMNKQENKSNDEARQKTELNWSVQMNKLNYLYGTLNELYYDFGQVEAQQDRLFLEISKQMGRVDVFHYMWRRLTSSIKSSYGKAASAAAVKLNGKTNAYKQLSKKAA